MSIFFSSLRSKQPIKFRSAIWWLIPLVLSPSLAHAYLDAGTGSYIIQVTVGVLFGATYTLKTYSARIVQYFKKKRTTKDNSEKK